MVDKIIPNCLHTQKVRCCEPPENFECEAPCKELLPCGHQCTNSCSEECVTECMVMIEILYCENGHHKTVPCSSKDKKWESCWETCNELLECGHPCAGKCFLCRIRERHKKCNRVSFYDYSLCGHEYSRSCCDSNIAPCKEKCKRWCGHTRCDHVCSQECDPCDEPCTWTCPHMSCSLLCGDPCDRLPCDENMHQSLVLWSLVHRSVWRAMPSDMWHM